MFSCQWGGGGEGLPWGLLGYITMGYCSCCVCTYIHVLSCYCCLCVHAALCVHVCAVIHCYAM